MVACKASWKAKKIMRIHLFLSDQQKLIHLSSRSLRRISKSNCDLILGRQLTVLLKKNLSQSQNKDGKKNMTNTTVTETDREGLCLHS